MNYSMKKAAHLVGMEGSITMPQGRGLLSLRKYSKGTRRLQPTMSTSSIRRFATIEGLHRA